MASKFLLFAGFLGLVFAIMSVTLADSAPGTAASKKETELTKPDAPGPDTSIVQQPGTSIIPADTNNTSTNTKPISAADTNITSTNNKPNSALPGTDTPIDQKTPEEGVEQSAANTPDANDNQTFINNKPNITTSGSAAPGTSIIPADTNNTLTNAKPISAADTNITSTNTKPNSALPGPNITTAAPGTSIIPADTNTTSTTANPNSAVPLWSFSPLHLIAIIALSSFLLV